MMNMLMIFNLFSYSITSNGRHCIAHTEQKYDEKQRTKRTGKRREKMKNLNRMLTEYGRNIYLYIR